ncbi:MULTISPECIES: helix-turn-helix domain-containing protein [Sphingomonas]|uniref:helix-turn-helix domain-containing protein n=1 Tax=Sphingomonas TaxID=13687 RepID=UPI001D130AA7|nr:helix-turn-helix domain-containing protein [Sphingomonas paucimobilis]
MAGHIRYLVTELGMMQHQAAALCGVNQGRVSETMRGRRFPDVAPQRGPFPISMKAA